MNASIFQREKLLYSLMNGRCIMYDIFKKNGNKFVVRNYCPWE